MPKSVRIQLPQREEMLRLLMEKNNDPANLERLYPLILEYAGQTLTGAEIVDMLLRTINRHCERYNSTALYVVMMDYVEIFAHALISDQRALIDANTRLGQLNL